MTAPVLSLGSVRVLSARIVMTWAGPWTAELDLDPDGATVVPAGAQVLAIGAQTLSGTIDPRATGRFGAEVRARLVAGAGGWDQPVPEQAFAADNGVSSTRLYSATAAAVGETVVDPTPVRIGIKYTRKAGRASQVFGDRDWYVDLAGVTQVQSRPPATPDASVEVLDYDPATTRATIAADAIVVPGTVLTDPNGRFDGQIVVRDVEQTFNRDGSRATVWCGPGAATRLMTALTTLVREKSGVTYARVYSYRHVSTAADGRLTLQATSKAPGLPDLVAISVWPGAAGAAQKLAPGQGVLVAFAQGDPAQPMAVGFDGSLPLEATIDATRAVHVGPSASSVDIAGGGNPVSRVGDTVTFIVAPFPIVSPTGAPIGTGTPLAPLVGIIQTGSPKVTAA